MIVDAIALKAESKLVPSLRHNKREGGARGYPFLLKYLYMILTNHTLSIY
jgi:hypothetical protein